MITATRNYFRFLLRCGRVALVGDWRYYAWMGALTILVLLGVNAYCKQLVHGLITTGMSDEVSRAFTSRTSPSSSASPPRP